MDGDCAATGTSTGTGTNKLYNHNICEIKMVHKQLYEYVFSFFRKDQYH